MDAANPIVTVRQLIYTNVEANDSPTRQRGFQIWLSSADLTGEQRQAVANRLRDFRLPVTVAPTVATAVRYLYTHLPEHHLTLIARTVPLAERDRFGRGGKFHSHAVLLSDDDFGRIGCDPFRLIDGGFHFHDSPDDAKGLPDWQSGTLPPVAWESPRGAVCGPTVLPPLLVELTAHLEQPEPAPVVLLGRPDQVLEHLRRWFALWPPAVRRRATFDTLSCGVSGNRDYVFLGAYTKDHARTWFLRRYHLWDTVAGQCTPPLSAPLHPLVGELLTRPGWSDLTDADREAVYQIGRSMTAIKEGTPPAEPPPVEPSPAAFELLTHCPSWEPVRQAAVARRIQLTLDETLVALPGVRDRLSDYFRVGWGELVTRLREPIPVPVVDEILYKVLAGHHEPPPPAVIRALAERPPVVNRYRPRLQLILRRWRATPDDLAELEHFVAEAGEHQKRAIWFRDWIAGTLPMIPEDEWNVRVRIDQPPTPEILTTARLWLLAVPRPLSATAARLRLTTALHATTSQHPHLLKEALREVTAGQPDLARDWLTEAIARRLKDHLAYGWAADERGEPYLGVFLIPVDPVDEELLHSYWEQAAESFRSAAHLGWELYRQLAPYDYDGQTRSVGDPSAGLPEGSVELFLQRLLDDGARHRRAKIVDECREYLTRVDDQTFAGFAGSLIEKASGTPTFCEYRPVTGVYFAGLRLHWVDPKLAVHKRQNLLEAVVGAVADEFRQGQLRRGKQTLCHPKRFAWLMKRLHDPAGTGSLPV